MQRAVERCVGMGRCRTQKSNTMCPSYRATREERYSTRGRSRLFWEMLQGEVITDGWKSEAVKEALDTCLSCKGCRSDCPTHVDMAAYKAEFLSHYYEGRRRPRQALFMGRIGDWAPVAARLPWLANFFTQTPVLRAIAKRVAGVASGRELPALAPKPFRKSFQVGTPVESGKSRPRVILWVDTFAEHFHPEIAHAAAEVLDHAGFATTLPPSRNLCCGRPLYDFGLLDLARAKLASVLDALAPMLASGGAVGVVGLEPGCLSVFKDELLRQFPDDPRAKLLSGKTWLLADFLNENGYVPPPLDPEVLVHAHCHQKSLFGTKGEQALLDKMGAKWTLLDSGCCGMAGSFGFHPDHEALSMKIGEEVLFPAIRAAAKETVVLTNGFSCREQIRHGVGREVMHFAELLLLAHRRFAERGRAGSPQDSTGKATESELPHTEIARA